MSHALLSASSCSRWIVCTPSARLETRFPDSAGDAAKEGTLAHELGEMLVKYRLHNIQFPYHNTDMARIKGSKFYSISMLAYCTDYADYVIERYNAALARDASAKIYIEVLLDTSDYVKEGFGTGDIVIVGDYVFEFIDLKYGKGVPVSATENKQLMLYALGVYKKFGFIYSVKVMRLTIYQPRLDSISTWEITVAELLRWAETELKPKADLAWKGEGRFVAGGHCGFCRAKAQCITFARYNLEIAKDQFPDAVPELLTDTDITKILERAASFLSWIKAVKTYALTAALKGKTWPGYKVVRGTADRKITDVTAAGNRLEQEPDLTIEQLYKPETLKGITELEMLLGKKRFAALVGQYVIKPDGAPTLVKLEDKRPALNGLDSALQAFSEIDFEDEE